MATIGSGQVGRSVRRLEGAAKVTGRAEYVHNLRLPGMLHGKIVRSTVSHGRIRSIDVEAARALAGVYDEVEAMTSKAIVHDVLKPAGTFPDLKHLQGRQNTNVALDFHLRRGDVASALAQADHVFEHTFRTQQVLHVPLEPFVSVAEVTDTGLTIHTASQSPSFVRIEIARLLGWPENKVRVKVPFLGGGFGAK